VAITKPLPTPTQAGTLVNKDGVATREGHRYFESLGKTVSDLVAQANTDEPWAFSVLVQYPEDGSQTVILAMPYAVTITSVTTKCTTGTATLTVKINSTALGGTANSVSTSEQTQAHSSGNAMTAGDDLVFTWSSSSSIENASVTVSGTVA